MPKIQRKTQKIFCNSADSDQLAVFGSMATGTPVYSNDVEQLQSNEAYGLGWDSATLEDKAPFMEEMNAMQYCTSYQLAYTLQTGIPEWDAETEYFENTSFCQVNGVIYQSKTNNNIGNNPTTDSTNWGLYGGGNYLTTSQITNCLLEVPQNIKVELGDNGLTLKAGSIVTFPNGANNFEHYTVPSDITLASYGGGSTDFFVMLNQSKTAINAYVVNKATSGTTAPTGEGLWYDTANNVVKFYNSSNELQWNKLSFPFAICSRSSGTITSIKQIFNGFGYIGNTIFCDKGIKGLIPNGFNADGTLSNTEFTTISVLTQTRNISGINKPLILRQDQFSNFGTLNYNENTNFNIDSGGNNNPRAIVGTWSADSTGRITSFQPKQPVHLLTWDDIRINNPYFFGKYIWSEFAPDNLSWLKSSGQWNSGTGYQGFYDWALANANANKAGFKKSTASYTDYDFVVNTSAKTFRLPIKVKGASGKAIAGNGMVLGLTNGTSDYGWQTWNQVANFEASKELFGASVGTGNNVSTNLITTANTYKGIGVTTNPEKSGIETSDNGLSLYFYVGETAKDPALINASQIASTYAEKLDKPVTYVNGSSGCRIWQDGFKEQWGKITGSNVEVNITFLQPFSNTDYTLTFGIDTAYNNWIQAKFYGSQNRTATGFTSWSGGGDHTAYKTWYACGY